MGKSYSKLSTHLAVLAILSATALVPALAATAPPPPTPTPAPQPTPTPAPPPAPTPAPPPSTTPRTPPPTFNQPSDPTPGHSNLFSAANPSAGSLTLVSCSANRPQLPDPLSYGPDSGSAVKAITRATEHFLDQCDCPTQACVAKALEDYADALAEVAPQLPLEMRNLPNIVYTAAHRVRAAHTRQQAEQALKVAIDAVHKTIALLRADDPVTLKAGTRAGGFVAETMQVASLKLEKSAGL
jgi:hypothetical protein